MRLRDDAELETEAKTMLAFVSRRNDTPGWPAANDNWQGSRRLAELASALRGAFPNITVRQAEEAAVQLAACGRLRDRQATEHPRSA